MGREPLVIDVRDAALWQDPYPRWNAAREQHRTAVTPWGEPILLSADDHDTASVDGVFAQLGSMRCTASASPTGHSTPGDG